MAGTGCWDERQKGLKNPAVVFRIEMTPPDLQDGGFAFSDVLDLRCEAGKTELFHLSIHCPLGGTALHNLPSAGVHPSLACFTERFEFFG